MKKIIIVTVLIFLMTFAASTAYCTSASSIDVNDFESTMTVGSTQTITAVVYPNDAGDSVSYSSSNTSVATISPGGKIEAKAKGTTTITVSAGAARKTLTLTVKVHTSKID